MPPQLPTDLLFHLFTYFPVTTLLLARGVSQQWCSVLDNASIHPIRRKLMDMYLIFVHEPWFLDSRPWTVDHLSAFDREAYINTLLNNYPYLPESFQIWVLEWPAKAAFACVWPGLPEIPHDEMGPSFRDRYGWNMLSSSKPAIWSLQYSDEEKLEEGTSPELLPAIPLFHNPGSYCIWLMLDPREEFRGRVLYTVEEESFSSALERNCDGVILPNWISYLHWEVARLKRTRAWSDKHGEGWGRFSMNSLPFREEDRLQFVPWIAVNTVLETTV